jgi:hypothetical protein
MPLNAVTVAYIAPPVYGAIIYYVAGIDDVFAAAFLSAAMITGALGAGATTAAGCRRGVQHYIHTLRGTARKCCRCRGTA